MLPISYCAKPRRGPTGFSFIVSVIDIEWSLTLQTYSSCVRTSTHRHNDDPSTCSKRRYFSATRAAWNWCWGGEGLAGAGLEGEGAADNRSARLGDCALSSALLFSPAAGTGTVTAGLLRRSGHNNEGDPGSITTQQHCHCHKYTNVHRTQTLKNEEGTTMRWTWSAKEMKSD